MLRRKNFRYVRMHHVQVIATHFFEHASISLIGAEQCDCCLTDLFFLSKGREHLTS